MQSIHTPSRKENATMFRFHLFALVLTASFAFAASTSAALVGSKSTSDDTVISVNLTTEGGIDWIKWGEDSATDEDQKAGGTALGSLVDNAGTTRVQITDDPHLITTWTDGTPDAANDAGKEDNMIRNNATNDETDDSVGRGFSFDVASAPMSRVLKVYTSVFNATGTFTATLGSESFTDTVTSNTAGVDTEAVWQVIFSSPTSQTLTIDWAVTAEQGITDGAFSNVGISAATLAVIPTPAALPAGLAMLGMVTLRRRRRS